MDKEAVQTSGTSGRDDGFEVIPATVGKAEGREVAEVEEEDISLDGLVAIAGGIHKVSGVGRFGL